MSQADRVTVGLATCGIAAGGVQVKEELEREIERRHLDVEVWETGCIGLCFAEVLVDVEKEGLPKVTYGSVEPKDVPLIVESHLVKGEILKDKVLLIEKRKTPESDFLKRQKRIVLRACGLSDPESIDDYISRDGYEALKKVLLSMKPEEVRAEVLASGLRGRGGAGFPPGQKWEFCARAKGKEKYIVCNADEGDPGAFMDRSVLEGDPHEVIEGIIIGAYAIGATHAYIYCRAEYPLAIKRLTKAIEDAHHKGFLGKNILGSGYDLDITIKQGAGAFVCGEETALIASIEGKRGMPRPRPPFPANEGIWGQPTNINNVETFANVPWIILNGAKKYAAIGTKGSKGTKVFCLTGKVRRGGLVEVEMGTTLREVIFGVGGGVKEGRTFKAVQTGGPSGGCLPSELLDTPIDYDSLQASGAIMGSGGMVVVDDTTCMVDFAKFFLTFTQMESCGKCVPCRIGTKRMLEILTRICEGKGEPEDIGKLERLANDIKDGSLCALGGTAPNPVLTTLRYFKDEYEAHIFEKRCPAGQCTELVTFHIDPQKCTGCMACVKNCSSGAIFGEKKKPQTIDVEKCIKCRECIRRCRYGAVYTV
ncbi:MAG: NADH-quinone oxidoreductase subunit NuoF [Actinomycetota bacterium]|nr:NADH-quinone oxidoreductase subunit NuoF [Actinomycetota bacterium]